MFSENCNINMSRKKIPIRAFEIKKEVGAARGLRDAANHLWPRCTHAPLYEPLYKQDNQISKKIL